MKIVQLLSFVSVIPAWLLPICAFLPCGCDDGRRDTPAEPAQQARLEDVVDKLAAIQAQLEQQGRQARGPRTLSKQQLREVFQPLADVLAQVLEQQQQDRQQWLAVVADMRRLSQLVSTGVAQKEQTELEAMRRRLQEIDTRLREQDRRNREAKAALIEALDAASGRLDGLLEELDAVAPGGRVEGSKNEGSEERKGKSEGKDKGSDRSNATKEVNKEVNGTGEPDQMTGRLGKAEETTGGSAYPFLVTLLAISAVVLVGWVVFFPDRPRPAVPRIQCTSRPRPNDVEPSQAGPSQAEPSLAEPSLTAEARVTDVDVEARPPEATAANPPQVVRLDVVCGDLERAAEQISGLLEAEPRVLLHPEPDLEVQEGRLAVRFYLVPSVPGEQQSRIMAAIQALAEECTTPGPARAADAPGDEDNDLPAA